jgi:nucleotide-binding universal stress UspA family protein
MISAVPGETPLQTPKTLQRILVALDGTRLGERVFPYVAALVRRSGAQVLLAHITPTEPPEPLGRLLRLEGSSREDALREFAPEAVYYLRYERGGWMDVCPQTDIVHITAPSVADGLLSIERSRAIDLVALALRAHDAGDHMGLGNIVDRVIRFGAAPVLVIPPEADAAVHPVALRHVLVTLDGSPLAEEALGLLAGLLAQAQAQGQSSASERMSVTLLAVADNTTVLPHYQAYLDALQITLSRQPAWANVRLRTEAIVGSSPGAIVGLVNQGSRSDTEPVDMLVMTTHGRGGLNRWLLGSVTSYVLPRVRVPVVVVRPESQLQQ